MKKRTIPVLSVFIILLLCLSAYAKTTQEPIRIVFIHESNRYTYAQNSEKRPLIKQVKGIGFSGEEAVRYVCPGIENTIKKMERDINREPVDSKVSFHPHAKPSFHYSDDKDGIRIHKPLLYNMLYERLVTSGTATVTVPTETIKPKYSRAFWTDNIVERASFTTSYAGSSADRKHNVALALKFYNGLVVKPGQAVSFNKLVGARSESRGFRKAKIIMNGEYEDGIGGGVCQSSTTLYNAFILAGLKVTERNPHSLTSSYVSPGFDAMVNMGSADLEFENNTDFPIYIKTVATDDSVTVKIFGEKPKYKIVRRKKILETIKPPPDKIFFDFDGRYRDKVYYVDEWHQIQPSKPGMIVESYLDYYEKGALVKTEKIHTDRYKTVQGVYVYGVQMRPQPEPEYEYYYPQN